jgi:hypothetical protein
MSDLPEPVATVQPMEYLLTWLPYDDPDCFVWSVSVEWRGDDFWVACHHRHYVLSKAGKWDREPNPSDRTDAWRRRHYFDFDTALTLAKEHGPKIRINGCTIPDLLAKKAQGSS